MDKLNLQDPTLFFANITAQQYLKTARKHQEKNKLDIFYDGEQFKTHKDEIKRMFDNLLERKCESELLLNRFRLFCMDCIDIIETKQRTLDAKNVIVKENIENENNNKEENDIYVDEEDVEDKDEDKYENEDDENYE
jgi:phosphopantothenoylcysteine synthetase/decarboxylase